MYSICTGMYMYMCVCLSQFNINPASYTTLSPQQTWSNIVSSSIASSVNWCERDMGEKSTCSTVNDEECLLRRCDGGGGGGGGRGGGGGPC